MRLRSRISMHFLVQFFILFTVSFLVIIGLLLLLINFITNEELDTNPKKAIVENTPTFTVISSDEQVDMNDHWKEQLKENQMWLQLINQQGDVIYEVNTPSELKSSYTINELLRIEETKVLDGYTVDPYYDTWSTSSYYFLFGYDDVYQNKLDEWYDAFNNEGLIIHEALPQLEKLIKKYDGMLEIYQHGELVQTAGKKINRHDKKLDVLAQIHTPGKQETKAFVYNDEKTDASWIFHIPNETYEEGAISFLSSELQISLLALCISLVFAVSFSIWNGYRYGKPLLLMIRWLEKVEEKQYARIFTEKEQRKVYKRNGKLKFRYRLYKEVFQSFSDMTTKLSKAEKERDQLDKTREEWMTGISHDLRTPLASIQGYGHILESDKYSYTGAELAEIGNVIRTKSDYMVDLLDDFSLVFKLKNSTVTLQSIPVELGSYAEKTIATFKQDRTMSAYTFRLEKSTDPVISLIDPKWFERVLDNLISNAVKHNPPHTIVTIKVKKDVTERPVIQIADNGIGMEAEFVEHLFNRYYRGTSTQERTEGEGLGMSIAKAVIDLHGGDIDVQSEKNKGTIITIQLQKPGL